MIGKIIAAILHGLQWEENIGSKKVVVIQQLQVI